MYRFLIKHTGGHINSHSFSWLWFALPWFGPQCLKTEGCQDDIHTSFSQLLDELHKKNAPYALSVANRLYGEKSYQFVEVCGPAWNVAVHPRGGGDDGENLCWDKNCSCFVGFRDSCKAPGSTTEQSWSLWTFRVRQRRHASTSTAGWRNKPRVGLCSPSHYKCKTWLLSGNVTVLSSRQN